MSTEMLSLKNHLLIAMPNTHDATFDRTVTLVCVNDSKGSFGITINRPTNITVGDVFKKLNLSTDNTDLSQQKAFSGGPLGSAQGFVLHDTDRRWESTMIISEDLAVTSSRDILHDIIKGNGPTNFLLTLGCNNWNPQQLEEEMMSNAWLTCPVKNSILFELPYQQRWEAAANSLGVNLSLMSTEVGHA
ncbi:MAG: YqgE/AlgH family protein [Cocleimonas sp.]|nr:YqgE/AlgH family protein [Cocleimonas sp.]